MSFNQDTTGKGFIAGEFLADDDCTRITIEAAANNAAVVTNADGSKYIPAGTIYPANGSTAKGIIYEHVDVSTGNMPASLVIAGKVYEEKLPVTPVSDAKSALTGIQFLTLPTVTRPAELVMEDIEVESAAGTAAGDTAITIDYTPGTGETLLYKVGTTAPKVTFYSVPDYTWTVWDGSSDITAATNKKITIVAVDSEGRAIAQGSATVTAKA